MSLNSDFHFEVEAGQRSQPLLGIKNTSKKSTGYSCGVAAVALIAVCSLKMTQKIYADENGSVDRPVNFVGEGAEVLALSTAITAGIWAGISGGVWLGTIVVEKCVSYCCPNDPINRV